MRKVEAKILNAHSSPSKVIDAFTELPLLKKWWSMERCYIEKCRGGIYILAWKISDKEFGYISTGIAKKYSPKDTLEIEKFVYMNPDKSILGTINLKNQCNIT